MSTCTRRIALKHGEMMTRFLLFLLEALIYLLLIDPFSTGNYFFNHLYIFDDLLLLVFFNNSNTVTALFKLYRIILVEVRLNCSNKSLVKI